MKRPVLWLLSLALALLAFGPALVAQNPNYNNGPVWRIIYVDVKPGMGDAFWTDIRQNFKPIYEEFKKQGWIVGERPPRFRKALWQPTGHDGCREEAQRNGAYSQLFTRQRSNSEITNQTKGAAP